MPDDGCELRYVVDLAKKNSEALSFIPTPKLEAYAAHGQVTLAYENDEPCGFLVHGNGWPRLKIYQACIQYDARRREHALEMVTHLIHTSTIRGYEAITLWCATDLEANAFWASLGFVCEGTRPGGSRRHRQHALWVFHLPHPHQGVLLR